MKTAGIRVRLISSVFLLGLAFASQSDVAPGGTARTLAVIALEYPPFTTETQADKGSSFRMLQKYLLSNQLEFELQPLFLPSARAQSEIIAGNWCASFYPPPDIVKEQSRFLLLSDEIVSIGIYRRRQPEPFVWTDLSELGGGKIALLRSRVDGGFLQQFTDAGLTIEFVSDVATGLRMLNKGRVDYAFGDSDAISVLTLPKAMRENLQFSSTHLMEVPVGVFVNPMCPEAVAVLETVPASD
ncbi:hypothetical protein SHAM105786_13570 [Shewanella amazonensis]|uniref:Solute-binding protein family 3/N-terminal domain-containing protein n=1 Tax=Shewanella amazonensis (strain ATCC BAA-1098 / SB2B) TaxID=326297 RepID=A1S893_SHEAM|nr:hypothetical protein [Shewanella amazonensis]ABM00600.1 hypothetical protein Sama_2395 [Shewanella amazonensis SB2B]